MMDAQPAARRLRIHALALMLALASLMAPPAALAAANCLFRAAGTLSLSFGVLDPSVGSTVVATMTVGTVDSDQLGDCTPTSQTMSLSAGNGQYYSGGSRRLSNGTDFIPYTIGGTGAGWAGSGPWTRNKTGNNTWVTIPTLTATILGVDYQNVSAGYYSDTVVLTISP